MFDINEVEPADLIPLRKAYALVGVLSGRDHMANFPWTVQLAEGARAFHEVLDRVDTAGINPVEFIAVHALAQCAVQMKGFPVNHEHFDSLRAFLDTMSGEYLGPGIQSHLREWAGASHIDPAQLAEKGPWAKLGAMTRSLSALDGYKDFEPQIVVEYGGELQAQLDRHRAIAAACRGLSPELDAYYEARLQEAGNMLKPQPPAAPPGGAPGPG